ncbi:MAG: SpoIIE family protein phosphatase [Acidobacteriota bacterium]|nr:SpoIIE family protein phosphatase [Acidobacteriota bacterium]
MPQSPPAEPPARPARELLVGTTSGRLFLGATVVRLTVLAIDRLVGAPPAVDLVGTIASITIVVTALMFIVRGFLALRRQLLWRVRRKLIVSYVFIGLVPALLLLVFFLFGGQIIFTNVASYLFKSGYEGYMRSAQQIAQSAANDVARDPARAVEILESKVRNLAADYPGLSVAVVPVSSRSTVEASRAGAWRHLDPPTAPLPLRFRTDAFSGTIVCRAEDGSDRLVIRAVAFPDGGAGLFAAIADMPLGQELADRLKEATGITAAGVDAAPAEPAGRQIEPQPCLRSSETGPVGDMVVAMPFRYDRSLAFLDYVDWKTGAAGRASVGLRVRLRELYAEITEAQSFPVGGSGVNFGQAMLAFVLLIAVLFLIIEVAALVMGLALARSITTAVHGLFTGTERVRQGDFTHRIAVTSRDQLGELADSFNQMSSSIEHLLQQAAEKRRLEEELRIAREIQMSLLPSGSLDIPGLRMTALCVPAREVGGDYYDYFKLSDRRFGLLIADVSGKGTSAALYMAELKGLLLSLSQIHQSPRQLLIEVNRLLSDHLDTRSFITMTYAVIDLDAATMVFARAGHTPLVYLPASARPGAPRQAQVHTPDGMVLGLRVPNIEHLFPYHLHEQSLPLAPGDVVVLYTDGISEAMNTDGDLFGEARLSQIIEEHGHLDVTELRERVLREVEAFAGAADQNDDLTMILLKIEEEGGHLPAVHTQGAVDV